MSKPPRILNVDTVASSALFGIERVDLRFSNGEQRVYERVTSASGETVRAVLILPVLNETHLLLIREYGVGLERYVLGFPKGAIDQHETAEIAAQRELQEETGYASRKLRCLARLAASPAYLSSWTDIFLASDLYLSPSKGDEPEPLELIPWEIKRLPELISHPDFIESRSAAALLHFQRAWNGS